MGVLRDLFGPSKEEVWRRLAEEMEGRFVAGGLLERDRVEVHTGDWTVTLDTQTVSHGRHASTYTRLRAESLHRLCCMGSAYHDDPEVDLP